MSIFPSRLKEVLYRLARWALGIREISLSPGVRKIIMRVAGIIEYQIELPYKTAEDITKRVKRFLGTHDIPYDDVDQGIRMNRLSMDGCPCFLVPEDGAVYFFANMRLREKEPSQWDHFIGEMKRSLQPWG